MLVQGAALVPIKSLSPQNRGLPRRRKTINLPVVVAPITPTPRNPTPPTVSSLLLSAVRCRQIVDTDVGTVIMLLKNGFPCRSCEYWSQVLDRLAKHPTPVGHAKIWISYRKCGRTGRHHPSYIIVNSRGRQACSTMQPFELVRRA